VAGQIDQGNVGFQAAVREGNLLDREPCSGRLQVFYGFRSRVGKLFGGCGNRKLFGILVEHIQHKEVAAAKNMP